MEIKSILIKELGSKLKILKLTKAEVTKELSTLTWPFSEFEYKTWILDSFVIGINNLTGLVSIDPEDKKDFLQKLDLINNEIYQNVLNLNPDLNPLKLFVNRQKKLTRVTGRTPICKLKSWNREDDFREILDSDLQYFVGLNSSTAAFKHKVVEEYFSTLDVNIKIRQLNEEQFKTIIALLDTETSTNLKYSILAVTLVTFVETINLLRDRSEEYHLNLSNCLKELYRLVIKYNSFLYLHVEEVRYLKKENVLVEVSEEEIDSFLSGLEDSDTPELEIKNLNKLPVKTIQNLRDSLIDNLYGQEKAIEALCTSIELAYTGFKSPNKPIGAFLFYGPTSTGKTELAKLLAQQLRGSVKEGLVKIPCGTVLNMAHTIQTLIGAPPSYVGHDNKSLLSSHFSSKPNLKVLLFDEIDKAHEKVFDLLLEASDEGTIMDSSGNILNLSEAILIFTCNTGQKEAIKLSEKAGFKLSTDDKVHQEEIKKTYKKVLSKTLKPEFLARLDGEFFFKRLDDNSLLKTSYKYLYNFLQAWAEKNKIKLEIDTNIFPFILEECKKVNGLDCHARHINNYIHKKIIKNLGNLFITKKIKYKSIDTLKILLHNNEITFEIKQKPAKTKKTSQTFSSPSS